MIFHHLEEQRNSVKKFTKFVNTNIKKLAADSGITTRISCITARHSFTTQIVRKWGLKGFVVAKGALGHAEIKTTENYFSGFEDKETKRLLMDIMKIKK